MAKTLITDKNTESSPHEGPAGRRRLSRSRLEMLTTILLLFVAGEIALHGALATAFGVFMLLPTPNDARIEFIRSGYLLALWLLPAPLLLIVLLRGLPARRLLLALFILPGILFAVYHTPYLLLPAPTAPDAAPRLTVLTYNVAAASSPDRIAAVADLLLATNADVVAIQELSAPAAESLSTTLAERYPHQALQAHPTINNRGQGVFSKLPIVSDVYWEYDALPLTHGHQRVMLDFAGVRIAVYNLHPYPPVEWEGGFVFSVRDEEDLSHRVPLEDIVTRALAETTPVILLGDFNMSDQFVEYALVTAHFTDAYLTAGRTMGYTYPANGLEPLPPIIRIDYAFHSRDFVAVAAEIPAYSVPGDHLPVLATLALLNRD